MSNNNQQISGDPVAVSGRQMAPPASPRDEFVSAMSHAASTVNVVTTDGRAGKSGLTLSAWVPVSADSELPTLLICVHRDSRTGQLIRENGVFTVNVLRESQSDISDRFAGRMNLTGEDKFDDQKWMNGVLGCPVLTGALIVFECTMLSSQEVGTHYLFLGAVHEARSGCSGNPLIYLRRSYARAVQY